MPLTKYPVLTTKGAFTVKVNGTADATATLANNDATLTSSVTLTIVPPQDAVVTIDYYAVSPLQIRGEAVAVGDGKTTKFRLANYPVNTTGGHLQNRGKACLASIDAVERDRQSGLLCIRNLNGNIRVWGARTIGGDDNAEFKYINVRRLLLFLRKSIEQGTQWVVFEPNDQGLWAKITRNVTAFLTTVWRAGALFGTTPQEAFYVRCNAETNPSDVREQGQVVTEIGVAIVKPAEFVVFRISQWAGPGQ